MNIFPNSGNRKRIILVLNGVSFCFLILLLGKFVGDGWLVPTIFIIGWIILMGLVVRYYTKIKKDQN